MSFYFVTSRSSFLKTSLFISRLSNDLLSRVINIAVLLITGSEDLYGYGKGSEEGRDGRKYLGRRHRTVEMKR